MRLSNRSRLATRPLQGSLASNSRKFGGADRLAYVPLRVLGDVGQKADDCSRQAPASNLAWLGEALGGKRAGVVFGTPENDIDGCEKFVTRGAGIGLALEKLHLSFGKLLAAQVCHQAVRAPRDVGQMKTK